MPAAAYHSFFKYLKNRDFVYDEKLPRLCFTVLNGGKALNSKVKFSKVYLIIDCGVNDEADVLDIYFKIQT